MNFIIYKLTEDVRINSYERWTRMRIILNESGFEERSLLKNNTMIFTIVSFWLHSNHYSYVMMAGHQ